MNLKQRLAEMIKGEYSLTAPNLTSRTCQGTRRKRNRGRPFSFGAGADLQSSHPLATHGWKQVHPGVWRATIGTPERFTPVSSRLVPAQMDAFAKLPKVYAAPLPPIQGKQTTRGCMVQFPLRPDEQIFGFGLQMLSFAQRGKKKVARVNADPKMDTGDSHAPVPFYVTTEGIGILIDTARYATFYFGDARPKPTEAARG